MKRRFLAAFLTVFLRLQIYKAIAGIFWQSASYVKLRGFSMLNCPIIINYLLNGDVLTNRCNKM